MDPETIGPLATDRGNIVNQAGHESGTLRFDDSGDRDADPRQDRAVLRSLILAALPWRSRR